MFDRIYGIDKMVSHLPDEAEKRQSALRKTWLGCLREYGAAPFTQASPHRFYTEFLSEILLGT